MKKILFAAVTAITLLFTGCYKSDIDDLKGRVDALETTVQTMQSNIATLQAFVNKMNAGGYITSYTTTSNGFTVTFNDGSQATITNGVSPVVTIVAGNDGHYYWAIDGKTTTNRADGDTPQLRINQTTGYWEYSLDGNTWVSTNSPAQGEKGDAYFSNVEIGSDSITFTFAADGSTITVPFKSEFALVFLEDVSSILAKAGATINIPYQIKGADANAFLMFFAPEGWSVEDIKSESDPLSGTIKIVCPETVTGDATSIKVLASDGDTKTVVKQIVITNGLVELVSDKSTALSIDNVLAETTVTVVVKTNMADEEFSYTIPEGCDWVADATTRAMVEKTYTFVVSAMDANGDFEPRSCDITFNSDYLKVPYVVTIAQGADEIETVVKENTKNLMRSICGYVVAHDGNPNNNGGLIVMDKTGAYIGVNKGLGIAYNNTTAERTDSVSIGDLIYVYGKTNQSNNRSYMNSITDFNIVKAKTDFTVPVEPTEMDYNAFATLYGTNPIVNGFVKVKGMLLDSYKVALEGSTSIVADLSKADAADKLTLNDFVNKYVIVSGFTYRKGGNMVLYSIAEDPDKVQPTFVPIWSIKSDTETYPNNAEVAIKATLVATYARGFLVNDASQVANADGVSNINDGTILVYLSDYSAYEAQKEGGVTYKAGDLLVINGKVSTYGGIRQLGASYTAVSKISTGSYSAPTIVTMAGSDFDDYAAAPDIRLATYKGALSKSGNYYNIALEGTSIVGSISYPETAMAESLDAEVGKSLIVTGYLLGSTGSTTKYANMMITSFMEVEEAPVVSGQRSVVYEPFTTASVLKWDNSNADGKTYTSQYISSGSWNGNNTQNPKSIISGGNVLKLAGNTNAANSWMYSPKFGEMQTGDVDVVFQAMCTNWNNNTYMIVQIVGPGSFYNEGTEFPGVVFGLLDSESGAVLQRGCEPSLNFLQEDGTVAANSVGKSHYISADRKSVIFRPAKRYLTTTTTDGLELPVVLSEGNIIGADTTNMYKDTDSTYRDLIKAGLGTVTLQLKDCTANTQILFVAVGIPSKVWNIDTTENPELDPINKGMAGCNTKQVGYMDDGSICTQDYDAGNAAMVNYYKLTPSKNPTCAIYLDNFNVIEYTGSPWAPRR